MKTLTLSRGKVALIDDADFEWLSQWKWHAVWSTNGFYAKRQMRVGVKKQRAVALHRVLVNAQEDQIVDHRDGNTLNNQRYNLRICNAGQSARNRGVQNRPKPTGTTSVFKGVHKVRKGWEARITLNGKRHCKTLYNEVEAARYYDVKAIELHGEFAKTNAMLGLL